MSEKPAYPKDDATFSLLLVAMTILWAGMIAFLFRLTALALIALEVSTIVMFVTVELRNRWELKTGLFRKPGFLCVAFVRLVFLAFIVAILVVFFKAVPTPTPN